MRDRLYDIHEAAALFDVSSRTLWMYIKRGLVTPTEVRLPRKQVFFSKRDIDAQKLIGSDEIGTRLRVTRNVLRRLLDQGLLNPFRVGLGVATRAWFREVQLPEIKEVVESQISAEAAAIRLIQHVGSVAEARDALQEPTRYGKWQVLRSVHGITGRRKVWCRCECGREVQVDLANLKSGRSKGCVQCQKPTIGKLAVLRVGTKFGRWRIVRYFGKEAYQPIYLCQCECGTEKLVNGHMLKAGRSKGCRKCAGRTSAVRLAALVRDLVERAGGRQQAIAMVLQVAGRNS